jgi:MerR family transcriptional regulator, glutamine synthetase repressor
MGNEIRRNMALFSMGNVMKLTELTARQIRYYEEQWLIHPERNDGNQRVFSLNDIDRLLEIKDLIDKGINIAGIKEIYGQKEESQENNVVVKRDDVVKQDLSDKEVHKLIKQELFSGRLQKRASMIQGELSRFLK